MSSEERCDKDERLAGGEDPASQRFPDAAGSNSIYLQLVCARHGSFLSSMPPYRTMTRSRVRGAKRTTAKDEVLKREPVKSTSARAVAFAVVVEEGKLLGGGGVNLINLFQHPELAPGCIRYNTIPVSG